MIDWKVVDIGDKAIFDLYYKTYESEVSDYSFTQLLLWAEAYDIKYAVIDGFLVVHLQAPHETVPYIHMPVGRGDLGRVIEKVKDDFEEHGEIMTIRSITRLQYIQLKKQVDYKMKFKLLRDQYEYVYPSHDLSKLNTKKLRRKLDMYKSFQRNHDTSVHRLSEIDAKAILEMLDDWYGNMTESDILNAEKEGIKKVLKYLSELDCIGCVIKSKDKPIAFSIGEALTDNMFLVLIEKAIRDYKGAYVALIKEFAHMYGKDYAFTNREEDLGIPGLRKSKLLYRPCRFVEKGVAYFSDHSVSKRKLSE